jgi:hypothetical protein
MKFKKSGIFSFLGQIFVFSNAILGKFGPGTIKIGFSDIF